MPQEPNGVHYYTYYRRQSRPEFRHLVSSRSIYAIWDDHDCATDDVWMGPFKDKPSWKLPLLSVFKENWNNPGYGHEDWPGCWFNFSIADVDFFMLDGRFYRTNPYDNNPTMLGPVQKAWLLSELMQSKATFKVIVSPVPWVLASKGEAKDTWNGFKEERKEIFDFLAENKIDGVFLLSADRHRSDAWRIDRNNGYPLYEFESSRLTNQHFHEVMPGSLFGYNEKQSFGLLTFDSNKSDPSVTYQIINIENELIQTLTINKSEISHED
jgi:alkaline phosphatase D